MSFVAIPSLIGPMIGPVAGGADRPLAALERRVLRQHPGRAASASTSCFATCPTIARQTTHPLDVLGLILFGGGIALLSYVLEVFGDHTLGPRRGRRPAGGRCRAARGIRHPRRR